MNRIHIKGSLLLLTIVFFVSCDKGFEAPSPPYALYKTNSDYFEYVTPPVNDNKEVIGNFGYSADDSRILITETDTLYNRRVKLDDGYVLSAEVYLNSVFTDVTFKEYVIKHETSGEIDVDQLNSRVIDKDPFIEFFEVPRAFVNKYSEELSDGAEWKLRMLQDATEEINLMIANNTLSANFSKLK